MKAILMCMLVHAALGGIIYVETETEILKFHQAKYMIRGTYSYIFSAQNSDGNEVALKIATTKWTNRFDEECRIYEELGVFKPKSDEELQNALNAGLPQIFGFGTIFEGTNINDSDRIIDELIGNPVIVMELTGMDLHSACIDRDKRWLQLTTKEWIGIGTAMVNTLTYIHSKGVIHGDISPENLVLSPDCLRVLLIDFGAAKLVNDVDLSEITGGNTMYMSLSATLAYAMNHSILDRQHDLIDPPKPSFDDDYESLLVTMYILRYRPSWSTSDDAFVRSQVLIEQYGKKNLPTEAEIAKSRTAMQAIIQGKTKFCGEIRRTFTDEIPATLTKLFLDTIHFSRKNLDPMYRPGISEEEMNEIDSSKFVERWNAEYANFPESANANLPKELDIVEYGLTAADMPSPKIQNTHENPEDNNSTLGDKPIKAKGAERNWLSNILSGCVAKRNINIK